MKVLSIILIVCGLIGGIGLIGDGDFFSGIIGGGVLIVVGAFLFRKVKRKAAHQSDVAPAAPPASNGVMADKNITHSDTDKPIYPHESDKIAPPKEFVDKNGIRWLAKYQYHDVLLKRVNISFDELYEYDYLDVQERNNGADIIFTFHGNDIGVLVSDFLLAMTRDFLERHEPIKAQVQKIQSDVITIRLYFYKPRAEVLERKDSINVKLIGNSGEEMQSSISCCDENDEVYIERDIDKERYVVWSGAHEIGYTPASIYETLYDLDVAGYALEGHITKIEYNDDTDKFSVWVDIRPQ